MNCDHIINNSILSEKNDDTFELWYQNNQQHIVNLYEIFKNEFKNDLIMNKITLDNFSCFLFEKSSNDAVYY